MYLCYSQYFILLIINEGKSICLSSNWTVVNYLAFYLTSFCLSSFLMWTDICHGESVRHNDDICCLWPHHSHAGSGRVVFYLGLFSRLIKSGNNNSIIVSYEAAGGGLCVSYLIITVHLQPFVLFIIQPKGHQYLQLPGIFLLLFLFVLHLYCQWSAPLRSSGALSPRMNIQISWVIN